MLTLEQAQDIVAAINHRAFITNGLKEDQPLAALSNVSLAEMLEAAEAVRAENRRREQAAKGTGESYSISMVPAERLIAAVFVAENYQPGKSPILSLPCNSLLSDTGQAALLFWPIDRDELEDEGSDDLEDEED